MLKSAYLLWFWVPIYPKWWFLVCLSVCQHYHKLCPHTVSILLVWGAPPCLLCFVIYWSTLIFEVFSVSNKLGLPYRSQVVGSLAQGFFGPRWTVKRWTWRSDWLSWKDPRQVRKEESWKEYRSWSSWCRNQIARGSFSSFSSFMWWDH